MLLKILIVAGLATFEIYAAIPAGFAFGLSPWLIFFASVTGGLTGVFVTAFLGDKIRAFFFRYKKTVVREEKKTATLAHRICAKYGIIGLGFLGTITVGAPISIAVGVSLDVPFKKLIVWCCLGVITRCTVFVLAGHYGLKLL